MREWFGNLPYLIKEWFEKPLQWRIFLVSIVFIALFSVLTGKLVELQIKGGEEYSKQYETKTERAVKVSGTRGNIYDADGNLLAYNKLSYNVIIADNGEYPNYNDRNIMLYKLAGILEKHEVNIVSRFEIDIDDNGNFYYTSKTDSAKKRFIANVYGVKTDELDAENGIKNPSDISAYEAFSIKVSDYAFDKIKDADGHPVLPSNRTLLDMVKILFAMRQTAFQKYETSTIVENIDEYCMAELLENQSELKGVSVEETYIRKYNNAKYFSHIIGYTGSIRNDDQLKNLQKSDPDYEISDKVGVTGIEKTMEVELKGKKGIKDLKVDSHGQILEVTSETDPESGNDFYLSIPQNLQIGVYHLLEQQLAGILSNKIVNLPASEIELSEEASDIVISIDDAYYQLINNNVINLDKLFDSDNSGIAGSEIKRNFSTKKKEVISVITKELLTENNHPLNMLSKENVAYMAFIYDLLTSDSAGIIDESKIDKFSESYISWKNDSISLRDYLLYGISEGWININSLNLSEDSVYYDSEQIFTRINDYVFGQLNNNRNFDKLIMKYMIINKDGLSGRLLCMLLYEQGIIDSDMKYYDQLLVNGDEYAYNFFIDRIKDIDITPAQLALDPCMGSVVITDVKTGDVLALVSYPGYDNNQINDVDYFNKCLNDQSLPLINVTTQTNKAPGSTLKPLSAITILEENVLSAGSVVDCTGVFDEVEPPIRCWIGRPGHGNLSVSQAIENSCNYCFASYGHMLSMTENDDHEEVYSSSQGLEREQKYLSMFGFDSVSGIQIDEKNPHMSDTDPERSAFGQGSHSYNNIQMARYTTALANNGILYNLTLLSKETDSEGNLIQQFPATVANTIDLSQATWNVVHEGLRRVITNGVARRVFQGYKTVQVAGKTGTAEEVKTRGNHGLFISYAPYDDPEIAVTTFIPFCYSSGNAARLARRVYDFYYGEENLTDIVNGNARGIEIINIVDG